MKDRWIYKYMRLAREVGTVGNNCYSRQIGAVIIDPVSNSLRSSGFNSPPASTAHCDDENYLRDCFWPSLTPDEKALICRKMDLPKDIDEIAPSDYKSQFISLAKNKGVCPRRYIDAKSGERSYLCSCQHAETNAITKAYGPLYGCSIFCWCNLCCVGCTGAIINAGIKQVYCLQGEYYHPASIVLFQQAKIGVIELLESELIDDTQDLKSLVLTKEQTSYV